MAALGRRRLYTVLAVGARVTSRCRHAVTGTTRRHHAASSTERTNRRRATRPWLRAVRSPLGSLRRRRMSDSRRAASRRTCSMGARVGPQRTGNPSSALVTTRRTGSVSHAVVTRVLPARAISPDYAAFGNAVSSLPSQRLCISRLALRTSLSIPLASMRPFRSTMISSAASRTSCRCDTARTVVRSSRTLFQSAACVCASSMLDTSSRTTSCARRTNVRAAATRWI